MKRILSTIFAAALGFALLATPARAVDWNAAAWFFTGMVVGNYYGPAYGYPYGYRAGYTYVPANTWVEPEQCYWTRIVKDGVKRSARVCY